MYSNYTLRGKHLGVVYFGILILSAGIMIALIALLCNRNYLSNDSTSEHLLVQ